MKLDINDLPVQFENIARTIGLENTERLFEEFGGSTIYFPTKKAIYKDARNREILKDFNGFNVKELCTKYNISETHIRHIIRSNKNN